MMFDTYAVRNVLHHGKRRPSIPGYDSTRCPAAFTCLRGLTLLTGAALCVLAERISQEIRVFFGRS